jgi:hypothetical protein
LNAVSGNGSVTNPTPVPAGRTLQARIIVTGQGTFNAAPVTCSAPTPTVTPRPTNTPIPTVTSMPTPTPVIPVCSMPVLTPLNSSCYKDPPTLRATRFAPANQTQFAVDDSDPFAGFWICNSGWISASSYVMCTNATNQYTWSARASSSTNACTTSNFATNESFGIDHSSPTTPNTPYVAGSTSSSVTFGWVASTDSGCATCGGNAPMYWIQGYYHDVTDLTPQPDEWFVNDGNWSANSCAAPTYTVTCTGHDGKQVVFGAREAKDLVNNISNDNLNTMTYLCPDTGKPTSTPTPTPLPPTPTPPVATWYKLKNASYHRYNTITDVFPASILAFDGDDDTNYVFNTGVAGLVSSSGSQSFGGAKVSTVGYSLSNYTKPTRFTGAGYVSYIKSRKGYKTITKLDDLEANKINIYVPSSDTGTFTISNIGPNSEQAKIEAKLNDPTTGGPLVLIYQGTIKIDASTLNASAQGATPKPFALIAAGPTGKIRIGQAVTELGGIYIADSSIEFAYDSPPLGSSTIPLKIKGNITTTNGSTADTTKRQRTDTVSMPSIFIDVLPSLYVDLLPYLSTSVYKWSESAP